MYTELISLRVIIAFYTITQLSPVLNSPRHSCIYRAKILDVKTCPAGFWFTQWKQGQQGWKLNGTTISIYTCHVYNMTCYKELYAKWLNCQKANLKLASSIVFKVNGVLPGKTEKKFIIPLREKM